jgi:hypothetical protein
VKPLQPLSNAQMPLLLLLVLLLLVLVLALVLVLGQQREAALRL